MQTLIAWDTSAIPNCATITSARLSVNVTNVSSGQYGIYHGVNTWQESQVTWNSIGGDSQQGDLLGAWTPSSTGTAAIALNALAVSALQGSFTTNSINVVIASQGTSNGLDMRDRESNQGPKLAVQYQETDCQTTTPNANYTVVVNGTSAQFSDLSSTNSGDIVNWTWDFGDNESSAQQNPSHEYSESGTYNVILTVTNAQGGSDSISKTVVITNQNQSQVFETLIATGNDDAEESSSGSMNLSSSDMELIRESSDQTVGLRFTNIDIPADATITQAYLQFTVDETGSSNTNLLIRAEDTDDAERFTSQRYNISNRATSNAAVNWQPPAWNTVSEQGTKQKTPDLSALVQETINNNGWTANNSMVFIITGEGKRTAEAYNGRSAKAAALHITYTLN
jgi:PKD repeat protein